MHAQQSLHDARGGLIQSILGHAVTLKPAAEMALAGTDRRLIKACKVHLLEFGMHQAADSSRGFAGPVEYRRLVPRDRDHNRRARQRRKTVLRGFQWQALERPAARRVVGSLALLERCSRQLEFAGEYRPERAPQACRRRPEGPAWRRGGAGVVIFNFFDDGGPAPLALCPGGGP